MSSLNAARGAPDCINRNTKSREKKERLGLTWNIGGNSGLLPFTETEHLNMERRQQLR